MAPARRRFCGGGVLRIKNAFAFVRQDAVSFLCQICRAGPASRLLPNPLHEAPSAPTHVLLPRSRPKRGNGQQAGVEDVGSESGDAFFLCGTVAFSSLVLACWSFLVVL